MESGWDVAGEIDCQLSGHVIEDPNLEKNGISDASPFRVILPIPLSLVKKQ